MLFGRLPILTSTAAFPPQPTFFLNVENGAMRVKRNVLVWLLATGGWCLGDVAHAQFFDVIHKSHCAGAPKPTGSAIDCIATEFGTDPCIRLHGVPWVYDNGTPGYVAWLDDSIENCDGSPDNKVETLSWSEAWTDQELLLGEVKIGPAPRTNMETMLRDAVGYSAGNTVPPINRSWDFSAPPCTISTFTTGLNTTNGIKARMDHQYNRRYYVVVTSFLWGTACTYGPPAITGGYAQDQRFSPIGGMKTSFIHATVRDGDPTGSEDPQDCDDCEIDDGNNGPPAMP